MFDIVVDPAARALRGAKAKTNFAPPPCYDDLRGFKSGTHLSGPTNQPTNTRAKAPRRSASTAPRRSVDNKGKPSSRGSKKSTIKAKVRVSDEVRTTEFMTHPPKKGVPLQSAMSTKSGKAVELDLKLGFCSPKSCSSWESTQESTATYQSPECSNSFPPVSGLYTSGYCTFSPDSPPLSCYNPWR